MSSPSSRASWASCRISPRFSFSTLIFSMQETALPSGWRQVGKLAPVLPRVMAGICAAGRPVSSRRRQGRTGRLWGTRRAGPALALFLLRLGLGLGLLVLFRARLLRAGGAAEDEAADEVDHIDRVLGHLDLAVLGNELALRPGLQRYVVAAKQAV